MESKSCHVASLLGANPADRRVLQAFPNMPAFAKEIADSISLCGTSAGVELLWFVRMAFPSARFHRVPNSFLVHNLHKTSIDVCLRRLPLLFEEGKTHFGNMNNLSQASSEFSIRTDLKADDRTRAKAGRAFTGTNLNTGLRS